MADNVNVKDLVISKAQKSKYEILQRETRSKYDEDYFERGIITGKSCYMYYSWMPEQTLRMVYYLIMQLPIETSDRVLDFGCAKGFLVKAFRILDIEAYGVDVSEYAISKVDNEVKEYCDLIDGFSFNFDLLFDWTISKDVFEHIPDDQLEIICPYLSTRIKKMFVVVPLAAENTKGRFLIPEYNRDTTHATARDAQWWKEFFGSNGWEVLSCDFSFKGCKESWVAGYPKGNAFIRLKSKALS
jgi:cyclopropane fatty-acyl-phospholipid synthase-like methyltransferase